MRNPIRNSPHPVFKTSFFLFTILLAACSGDEKGGPPTNDFSACLGTVTLDFPFNYTLASDHIAIETKGGILKTMLSPWGAHVQPFTGHLEGNGKSDWAGYFAFGSDDPKLVELEDNDAGGKCLPNDLCGIHVDSIRNRIPDYVAPDNNFEIVAVILDDIGTNLPFSDQKWAVVADLCNYRFTLGHIARMSDDLRKAIIDAGLPDPDTVTTPGTEILQGTSIVLNKGQSIAQAEVTGGQELSGHPDFYGRNIRALIEYNIADMLEPVTQPKYLLFPQAVQDQFEAILFTEASKPDSFIFAPTQPWQWRAEMDLFTVPFVDGGDYSSIYAAFGGWWERADVACVPFQEEACDLLISIFPILKDSSFYDADLYHSPDVSYLVGRRAIDNPFGAYFGEVISPGEPDPNSGTLTIKWRKPSGETFQTIAYALFPELPRLKIQWGVEVADLASVDTPSIPSAQDDCNGTTLTCHSHDGYWTGSGGP